MKLPAVSRADLLRFANPELGVSPSDAAALLGYWRPEKTESPPASPAGPTKNRHDVSDPKPEPLPLDASVLAPSRTPLSFLCAVESGTLQQENRPRKPGRPITDRELAVDWSKPGPPLPPLTPWARLSPFLKKRLGVHHPSNRVDWRRVFRRLGTGLPFDALARLPRTAWAPKITVLWDLVPEMHPFISDGEWLLPRLIDECGRQAVRILPLRRLPVPSDVGDLPAGSPVVALSAMGQLNGSKSALEAWQRLGATLRRLDLPHFVLTPCPQPRWHESLAADWPAVVWDRHPRLPRQGFHPALKRPAKSMEVETLLDLLAPASRIEPPLLRESRLSLGIWADAGTEWDAWHHPDCHASFLCFEFRPGEAYAERLRRRSSLPPSLICGSRAKMRTHHETSSSAIAAEALLRACLSGSPDEATLEQVTGLFQRIVDRLREIARVPGGEEGRQSGLPSWYAGMAERLSPEMRDHPAVRALVAEGLACAAEYFKRKRVDLLPGVDADIFFRTRQEIVENPPAPEDWRVVLKSDMVSAEIQLQPLRSPLPSKAVVLGHLRAGRRSILLSGPQLHRQVHLELATERTLDVLTVSEPSRITLVTDHQKLILDSVLRPPWAERMWQDRYGLAAEFRISGVSFVMRWIPPGRFLMGSPEGEVGRFDNEGPQHEVTLTQGFWLGETPVTQDQWRVVVEKGDGIRSLRQTAIRREGQIEVAPSHFKGDGARPVEQVDWLQSTLYCQWLRSVLREGVSEALPESFTFHLPTEAQWEYACRAGTVSAFSDGSPCTKPEGKDPALDALGWFYDNSGSQTHPVKQKDPNAWGLYDMHGNVWEWCLDYFKGYTREPQQEPLVQPPDDTAWRVVRGGSWGFVARGCRSACRGGGGPGARRLDRGLRLAAGHEPRAAEPRDAERPGESARRSRSGAGRSQPRSG